MGVINEEFEYIQFGKDKLYTKNIHFLQDEKTPNHFEMVKNI